MFNQRIFLPPATVPSPGSPKVLSSAAAAAAAVVVVANSQLSSSQKPIKKGVIGHTLMIEEARRQKVNHGDIYVIRFYNRLDETKKGQIAYATAGEAWKWMEACDHAKQQVEYEISRGVSAKNKLNKETEIDLEAHRPRVRQYANGLKRFIKIGQGHRCVSLILEERAKQGIPVRC